jgi:hypothetical protein
LPTRFPDINWGTAVSRFADFLVAIVFLKRWLYQ